LILFAQQTQNPMHLCAKDYHTHKNTLQLSITPDVPTMSQQLVQSVLFQGFWHFTLERVRATPHEDSAHHE
jgi:hypothetical protein